MSTTTPHTEHLAHSGTRICKYTSMTTLSSKFSSTNNLSIGVYSWTLASIVQELSQFGYVKQRFYRDWYQSRYFKLLSVKMKWYPVIQHSNPVLDFVSAAGSGGSLFNQLTTDRQWKVNIFMYNDFVDDSGVDNTHRFGSLLNQPGIFMSSLDVPWVYEITPSFQKTIAADIAGATSLITEYTSPVPSDTTWIPTYYASAGNQIIDQSIVFRGIKAACYCLGQNLIANPLNPTFRGFFLNEYTIEWKGFPQWPIAVIPAVDEEGEPGFVDDVNIPSGVWTLGINMPLPDPIPSLTASTASTSIQGDSTISQSKKRKVTPVLIDKLPESTTTVNQGLSLPFSPLPSTPPTSPVPSPPLLPRSHHL